MPARPITPAKGKGLGQAVEADEAFAVRPRGRITLVIETDAARPITVQNRRLVGKVTETSETFAVDALRGKQPGQAFETDTANRVYAFKRGEVNNIWMVLDTDELQPFFDLAFSRASPTVLVDVTREQVVVRDRVVLQEHGSLVLVAVEDEDEE